MSDTKRWGCGTVVIALAGVFGLLWVVTSWTSPDVASPAAPSVARPAEPAPILRGAASEDDYALFLGWAEKNSSRCTYAIQGGGGKDPGKTFPVWVRAALGAEAAVGLRTTVFENLKFARKGKTWTCMTTEHSTSADMGNCMLVESRCRAR